MMLDWTPIVLALLPWVGGVLAGAGGILAVALGARYGFDELARRRRRPKSPKQSRAMILESPSGEPVLDGQVLLPGDRLQLRAGGHGPNEWVDCTLAAGRGGVWALVLDHNRAAVPAVGQLARWRPENYGQSHAARLKRVRHCLRRCSGRFGRSQCGGCEIGREVARLRRRDDLTGELARLLYRQDR